MDGSLVKKKGFPQVGAAAVGYHKGVEVFSKKMGMGGIRKMTPRLICLICLAPGT